MLFQNQLTLFFSVYQYFKLYLYLKNEVYMRKYIAIECSSQNAYWNWDFWLDIKELERN